MDRSKKELNCSRALEACAQQLKVDVYLTAKEMAEMKNESIGLMATLIQLRSLQNSTNNRKTVKQNTQKNPTVNLVNLTEKCTVNKQVCIT